MMKFKSLLVALPSDRTIELKYNDEIFSKFRQDAKSYYENLESKAEHFDKFVDDAEFRTKSSKNFVRHIRSIIDLGYIIALLLNLFVIDFVATKRLRHTYGISFSLFGYFRYWLISGIMTETRYLTFESPEAKTAFLVRFA